MPASALPRRLPSADRRQQILQVAARLFMERGFEAVSMGDIATALHVSRPTIYSYFTGPEQLLEALFDERLPELWARLSPLLPELQARQFAPLFRFLLSERETLLLLHSGGGPVFRQRRQAFLDALGTRIEAPVMQARKSARPPAPHLLLLLTVLLDGVAYAALTQPGLDEASLGATLDRFVRGGLSGVSEAGVPEPGVPDPGPSEPGMAGGGREPEQAQDAP